MAGFSLQTKIFSSFSLIIWISITWGILTLFSTFLLVEGEMLLWRDRVIYLTLAGACLGASCLCLRNWLLPKIVSDRRIWLCWGLGLIVQLIGNSIYTFWDLVLPRNPDPFITYSFRFISYTFLVVGIVLAVRLRNLSISKKQSAILTGLTIFLLSLALRIIIISESLETLDKFWNFCYILADLSIFFLSLTLLLTYWKGKFARTWLAIAFASSCFYLADIWHFYTLTLIDSKPTSILDLSWTFGAIVFGIGAAWEYQLSIISPRYRHSAIDLTKVFDDRFISDFVGEKSKTFPEFSVSFSKIFWGGIIWAALAFFYLVLSSVLKLDLELPSWFELLNYLFSGVAFLVASYLCLNNWRLSRIISDRRIWLCWGLGLLNTGIAKSIEGLWEIFWQLNFHDSLAHPFLIVSSLFLTAGMVIAVKSKEIGISVWQLAILAFVTAFSIGLAFAINLSSETIEINIAITLAQISNAPAWVFAIEKTLAPLVGFLHFIYAVIDTSILILATALLLTYWGGKFVRTWLLISCACLCFYLENICRLVSTDFALTAMLDFLGIVGAIFFAMAAAWEYQISTTPPRSSMSIIGNR